VPTWRTDVLIQEDLVEELGRIDGYDKIEASPACGPVLPPAKNYFWLWKAILRDTLISAGWSETRNYTFVSERDCRGFGYDGKDLLRIKNPVNADFIFMRPSLLVNLAKNIAKNPGCEELNQFEIGKIFGANKRDEPTMLAGVSKGGTFFEVKGVLEFALRRLGITDYSFVPMSVDDNAAAGSVYDSARSARLVLGKKTTGMVGQLNDDVAAAAGIKSVMVFELSVDALAKNATRKNDYRPISTHPAAIRDISIDVPAQTLSASVVDLILAADTNKLIKTFEIPDRPYVYGDGKNKNILFKFNLQSSVKTLDPREINDWQEKTIAAIEKNPLWRVKKEANK
jgi:phenylalanyl-tRNA synthetase beta chain